MTRALSHGVQVFSLGSNKEHVILKLVGCFSQFFVVLPDVKETKCLVSHVHLSLILGKISTICVTSSFA